MHSSAFRRTLQLTSVVSWSALLLFGFLRAATFPGPFVLARILVALTNPVVWGWYCVALVVTLPLVHRTALRYVSPTPALPAVGTQALPPALENLILSARLLRVGLENDDPDVVRAIWEWQMQLDHVGILAGQELRRAGLETFSLSPLLELEAPDPTRRLVAALMEFEERAVQRPDEPYR